MPRAPPAGLQHLDQVGEREQIGHTERGSPGGHNHKRILRDNVGPTGRDLPHSTGVVVEIDAMASPAVAVRDELVSRPNSGWYGCVTRKVSPVPAALAVVDRVLQRKQAAPLALDAGN